MTKKLNRRSQQRLKRMVASVDSLNNLLAEIKVEDLEDFVRRDVIVVNPYEVSQSSDFNSRSNGQNGSSIVERSVIARLEGRNLSDPVREKVLEIELQILEAEKFLRAAVVSIDFLKRGVERKKVRQTSNPCEICLVLPAIKSGMCMNCQIEWVEAGAPDRFRWKAYKHELTSSDGKILVKERPPGQRTQ